MNEWSKWSKNGVKFDWGAGVYVGHLQEDMGIMSETMNERINL